MNPLAASVCRTLLRRCGVQGVGDPSISHTFDVLSHRDDLRKVSLLEPTPPPKWMMTPEWINADGEVEIMFGSVIATCGGSRVDDPLVGPSIVGRVSLSWRGGRPAAPGQRPPPLPARCRPRLPCAPSRHAPP